MQSRPCREQSLAAYHRRPAAGHAARHHRLRWPELPPQPGEPHLGLHVHSTDDGTQKRRIRTGNHDGSPRQTLHANGEAWGSYLRRRSPCVTVRNKQWLATAGIDRPAKGTKLRHDRTPSKRFGVYCGQLHHPNAKNLCRSDQQVIDTRRAQEQVCLRGRNLIGIRRRHGRCP